MEDKTIQVEPHRLDRQIDTDDPCVVLDNPMETEFRVGSNHFIDCPRVRINFWKDACVIQDGEDGWSVACLLQYIVKGKVKSSVPVLVKGDEELATKVRRDFYNQLSERGYYI